MRAINNMPTSQVAKRKAIKITEETVCTACKAVHSHLEAVVAANGGNFE